MTFKELPDYCKAICASCTNCSYKSLCKRYYNKFKCDPWLEETINEDTPALGKGLESMKTALPQSYFDALDVKVTGLKQIYVIKTQSSVDLLELTEAEYNTIEWFRKLIKADNITIEPLYCATKEVGDEV